MPERATISTDAMSVLALIFGAAVIVPSVVSLVITLLAVAYSFL
jgi:hypothetical protein